MALEAGRPSKAESLVSRIDMEPGKKVDDDAYCIFGTE
jgi:hypothetical protein